MIDLSKILFNLPVGKIRELATVTQRIVDTRKAELIILYGSYARGDYKEQQGVISGGKSDYDILAISPDIDKRDELRAELRDMFEDIDTAVQVIVEEFDFVNRSLGERQYFFTDIKLEGKILYDSGKYQLVVPVEINPVRRREIAENDFNEWFETARSNFKGFKLRFANASCPKDFMLCAFDLQQAVEICYKTVEVVFSHYIPYEHRLIILLGRALKFDRRIKQAFPRETEEERNLFDQLDLAYIGARYHSFEEFPVYKEQLIYWCDKAEKVLALTREICREKIDLLKNIEKDFNG